MNNSFQINVFNLYPEILPPVAGYIAQIVGEEVKETVVLDVKTKTPQERFLGVCERDTLVTVTPGLYHVVVVGKPKSGKLSWFHYLFVITDKGDCYPVAEYLYCYGSEWLDEAQNVLKAYFKKKKLSSIKLTEIPRFASTQILVKK